MLNYRIPVLELLQPEESKAIESFVESHVGLECLPQLASFLHETFALELVLDPDIVAGFAVDSSNLPGTAQGLCRPKNERECAVLLRTCFLAGIPVTVSGGKSNLTGSATPQGGVVLSTVRMLDPLLSVNVASCTALAPVGMVLEDLRKDVERLSEHSLIFPVDPTSRADASVGGCLACNASGFTPGAAGSFRSWVTALRFLLPDGACVVAERGDFVSEDGRFVLEDATGERQWPLPRHKRPPIKNAGGPYSDADGRMDFVDLVIGSEGLFGVVSACSLKLTDKPDGYLDLFVSLPTEAEALRLLQASLAHFEGDLSVLSAFEYFGVNCRGYMKHEDRFFRSTDQVAVYVQEPLLGRDLEGAADVWIDILASAKVNVEDDAILLLDSDSLRRLFMEARHSMPSNAIEVVQRRGTFTIMTDCVVPPEHLAEFLQFSHERIAAKGMDYLSFGHLGDCHLHFTILPTKGQVSDAVSAYDDIVARSAALGGVYSGEHGTGKRKRKDFLCCYGAEAVRELQRVKAAVDPRFLLNRGNVVEMEIAT